MKNADEKIDASTKQLDTVLQGLEALFRAVHRQHNGIYESTFLGAASNILLNVPAKDRMRFLGKLMLGVDEITNAPSDQELH